MKEEHLEYYSVHDWEESGSRKAYGDRYTKVCALYRLTLQAGVEVGISTDDMRWLEGIVRTMGKYPKTDNTGGLYVVYLHKSDMVRMNEIHMRLRQ
jgi:hypothetical protein